MPTPAPQKKLNAKNSVKTLEKLLQMNFKQKDYELILTYAQRVTNISRAKKDIQNYFKQLRRTFGDIKYIWLMSWSGSIISFRIFIQSTLDYTVLISTWRKGKAYIRRLGNEITLPADTVTAPVLYRRWSCSKNLKRYVY